jgi:NTP pyrophosphatase (non-canonical NTP hydrolase)
MQDLNNLQTYLRQFAKDREWDQFHSPKNLSMALSVEVSELVENFQWLTEEQSYALDERQRAAVIDEIADVQMYLARLADKLDINIGDAIEQKIIKNEAKYPAEKVKGSSKKYNQYDQNSSDSSKHTESDK